MRNNSSSGAFTESDAPKKLATTPGMANHRITRQCHTPPRKKSIFHMSPNQWMMPTNRSVTGKGKKSSKTGTIMVEAPNPDNVPTTEAKKTRMPSIIASPLMPLL